MLSMENKKKLIKKNKLETTEISTTEDKVRLALKERKEARISSSHFFTYITLLVSFLIPLFTSDFKDLGIIKSEVIKGVFIVLCGLFSILSIIELIKIIKNKISEKCDDDWFVYRIQGKTKPPKGKKLKEIESKNISFSSTNIYDVLSFILKCIVYLLPLLLWIIVISLVGWGNAWSSYIPKEGDLPVWAPTLIFSCIWFFVTYSNLIIYASAINEFFDDMFD